MTTEKPIFLIGCPRSGTTIVAEVLAAHQDLAWFSNWMDRFPRLPVLAFLSRLCDLPLVGGRLRGAKPQQDVILGSINRYLPRPEEAWSLWESCCTAKFSSDMLRDTKPTADQSLNVRRLVSRTLLYQGKRRFLTKLTGPPRIEYLQAIFPDARFVHVIRDGRAVVSSLLHVGFWRERGGLERPWWSGLPETIVQEWERHGKTPEVLAAVQWKYLIQVAREERNSLASEQYLEIKYEDFTQRPTEIVGAICRFCDLLPSPAVHSCLESRTIVRDMNFKWRDEFSTHQLQTLNEVMGPLLNELGYPV